MSEVKVGDRIRYRWEGRVFVGEVEHAYDTHLIVARIEPEPRLRHVVVVSEDDVELMEGEAR